MTVDEAEIDEFARIDRRIHQSFPLHPGDLVKQLVDLQAPLRVDEGRALVDRVRRRLGIGGDDRQQPRRRRAEHPLAGGVAGVEGARKSVGWGKSVSVRVDLGGGRTYKK